MSIDDQVKGGIDPSVEPVVVDVGANIKIDDEHKDTIGITCTSNFILLLLYVLSNKTRFVY